MTKRRKIVAVIGNGSAPPEIYRLAEDIGRLLVERGYRVVTGGLGGVMEAASRGAHAAASYREGDVIGIVPGGDAASANEWVDVVVPSNLGIARNALVVSTADAVIAVGGGSGTLSELSMAWQLGRPLVGLDVAGWSGNLAGRPVDERRSDVVLRAEGASEAVELVARALGRVV